MSDAADTRVDGQLAQLIEIWQLACADFVALARDIPSEEWGLPTDLQGWAVKDIVAHTAHLEAVLAGAPEETVEVPDAPHVKSLMGYYTEQGVLARRDRDKGSLLEEIERSVATRSAALEAEPPTDPAAAPPRTPGGVPWNNQTLLSNRPVDVWMHEQDIRRAIGRPGGYDSPVATHVLRVFSRALPMVVGKRVAPPVGTTVCLAVPDAGLRTTVRVGEDGRASRVDDETPPTTTVSLSPQDFVVLSGGRRPPESAQVVIDGEEDLGRRLLAAMTVTP
jgi:uncharacterized protein (TIGR03083 family)